LDISLWRELTFGFSEKRGGDDAGPECKPSTSSDGESTLDRWIAACASELCADGQAHDPKLICDD
jgi:hypothetical protein